MDRKTLAMATKFEITVSGDVSALEMEEFNRKLTAALTTFWSKTSIRVDSDFGFATEKSALGEALAKKACREALDACEMFLKNIPLTDKPKILHLLGLIEAAKVALL